jgi:hypothetical protein
MIGSINFPNIRITYAVLVIKRLKIALRCALNLTGLLQVWQYGLHIFTYMVFLVIFDSYILIKNYPACVMKRPLLLLLLLFCHTLFAADNDSLIRVLEKEMAKREQYDAAKEGRIKQLKQLLNDNGLGSTERYNLTGRLILEYIPYNFKQALFYINKNVALGEATGNIAQLYEAKLQLAEILSSSGNYSEAREVLSGISRKLLPKELLDKYYYCYAWLNYRLHFYSPLAETNKKYAYRYNAYADSLMGVLEPTSGRYLLIAETRNRENGMPVASREANLKLMAQVKPGTRTYGSVNFFLAHSYLSQKDTVNYKKYLILSALSDIRTSVKDNAALTSLAVQLFKENDIERAHQYINFAFEDAAFYNSRLRLSSLSNILPLINKAYETAIQRQKDTLQGYLVVISVLGLLLLALLFYIWRQVQNINRARKNLEAANARLNELNKQLQDANSQLKGLYGELSDTNRVKEYYIGNLLNVCSEYLDKLDVYRKTVKKMIIAKQIPELLERTKSGQVVEEELALFYKNFDAIFLHIYPDFVVQLNALLLENERIALKKGELLSTELRIFALIRLGINDSASIAKLLRYSVNTIYNYRVKIKNKAAVSRDDFESLVMKIGAFSK